MVSDGECTTAVSRTLTTAADNGRTSERDKTKVSTDERVFAVVSTLKSSQPAVEQSSGEDDGVDERRTGQEVKSTPSVELEPTVIALAWIESQGHMSEVNVQRA